MTTNTKGTTRVVRTIRNAAARSSTEAKGGRARALSAPAAGTIPVAPVIPDAQADGLLNYPAWKSPLKVIAPLYAGATAGDSYYLKVDNDEELWDSEVILEDPLPTGGVELFIPLADLNRISGAERGEDRDGHDLTFTVFTAIGSDEFHSLPTRLIIDRTPAGGERLPPIEFSDDIRTNGLSLAKLESLGGTLEGVIASYEYQAPDDQIHLYMMLAPAGPAIDAGVISTGTSSSRTSVFFDEATLRQVPGGGTVNFFYTVIDRAGNDRFEEGMSAQSPVTPVRMLIEGAPETELFPPIVPDAVSDGLIVDAEARPAVTVNIPAYDTPEVDDRIVLHFGLNDMTLPPLQLADIGNNPVLSVQVPYEDVWQTAEKDTPVFPVTVNYDVERLGFLHRSGDTDIDVDLSLPGGPDPDPESPFNDNLPLPLLRGATGSTDNIITPADALVDAKVIIAGRNLAQPPAEAFADGDEITLIWDGDEIATVTVGAADVGSDLEVVVTPENMADHIGTSDLWYQASRTLAEGGPNVALSKTQPVAVQSAGELPGGGSLSAVTWVEGKTVRPPGRPDAINYTKATTPPGSGTPVRIYEYTNIKAGDVVTFTFAGYVGPLGDTTSPVTGSDYGSTYTVTAADLVAKADELNAGASAVFFDIDIPQPNLLKIIGGWGSFDFTVENEFGEGTGAQSRILIDCVPPN